MDYKHQLSMIIESESRDFSGSHKNYGTALTKNFINENSIEWFVREFQCPWLNQT